MNDTGSGYRIRTLDRRDLLDFLSGHLLGFALDDFFDGAYLGAFDESGGPAGFIFTGHEREEGEVLIGIPHAVGSVQGTRELEAALVPLLAGIPDLDVRSSIPSCDYARPPSSGDTQTTLEPSTTRVLLESPSGETLSLAHAASVDCSPGWFIDNDRLRLCPGTCEAVQSRWSQPIEVRMFFQCET